MNKRILIDEGQDYFALIICGALFICGAVAGTSAAGAAAGPWITGYFEDLISNTAGQAVNSSAFFAALFSISKYHLAAVFFGFSVLGVVCLPALSAVRGFFLCFTISAIVRSYGGDGVLLALLLSGLSALITVPCFFILTVQSFKSSLNLLKSAGNAGFKNNSLYGVRFIHCVIICALTVSLAAVLDMYLVSRAMIFLGL